MEVAPGVWAMEWLPAGAMYVLNIPALGLGRRPGIAMAWDDWTRIDPVEREKLADELTRRAAEDVIEDFQKLLERT